MLYAQYNFSSVFSASGTLAYGKTELFLFYSESFATVAGIKFCKSRSLMSLALKLYIIERYLMSAC